MIVLIKGIENLNCILKLWVFWEKIFFILNIKIYRVFLLIFYILNK